MTRLISILLLFCCGLATASLPRDAVRLREDLTAVANDGQRVIQERDANNTVLITYTRGLDQGRNQAVGSVPLAGSFGSGSSLFAAYRSMKDMRAAHASSGAKIYGAIVDLPTSWSRQSQTLDGAGGIGGLLARSHPGNKHFYYHADANGNVTAIVNQNQTLVAQYRYDPFGGLVSQSGPLAEINLYRFSSKEFHPPSGLYYYGYLFYDPNLQRWLNRDPSGSKDGPNLFAFVHNGPINAFDTWGLEDFSFSTIWLCANRYGFGYAPSEVAARIVGPNFYTDYAQGKFEYNCITADSSRVLSEMVDYVNRRVKAEQDAQTLESYEPPGVKGLGASDEEVKAGVNLIEKLILIEGVGSVAIVTGAALALLTSMKGSSIRACQVRTKNSCSRLSFLSKRASERRRAPDLAAAFEPAFFSINSNPSLLEGIRSVIHLVLAGSPCHLGYGGFLEPWNRSSQGSGPTRRWRVQKNLSSVLGPFSFYRTVVPGRQALSLTFHWLPIRSNGLNIASPSALLLGLV